ncbi:MAG: ATP-binding cassette domain-containing protein [Alphaproteobacteria bacterium]|nr:ATP-binding cassette domain-containing protein [Alphaproteobacteria bacterium]
MSEPEENSPIISFDKVMVRYKDSAPILSDISLTFQKKSFTFITGASGAGKTTLMRMLYAGIRPSSGILKIFGQDISTVSGDDLCKMRQKIGVVFQDFNLLNYLTVLENVALPLKVIGEPIDSRLVQAKEILDWVGLGGHFNSYPDTLSGGQKQRIAIARAVITRPEILLADEPTGNVDDKIAAKLMNLFHGMYKMGTCVIIATHNRRFVEAFNYSEIHIVNGKVIQRK